MGKSFGRIILQAHELPGYRAAVIACSRDDERELCERLLGTLASLEAQAMDADPDSELEFYAPPGASALAQRAVDNLRARPLRRRRIVRERRRSTAGARHS
jgi:hypothetical protein